MCMAFGRTIGLDREIVDQHVPGMVHHLRSLFESSAKLTLFPPSLALRLKLNVWRRFEESAMNALQTANQLTETCLKRLKENTDEESSGCIVGSLRRQNVNQNDIQRVVADLFLAAADTVNISFDSYTTLKITSSFSFMTFWWSFYLADISYDSMGSIPSGATP